MRMVCPASFGFRGRLQSITPQRFVLVVVVAGRKPHVSNILGVSTGTLPVSVCLLPVPVSTLSYTPFHRSPTINSQRIALFDSTFSVRFKLISHSLSAPFPLPLRSARPKTCPLVSCASASASAAGRGCRQPTPARHEPRGSWVHFVRTGTEGPSCTKVVAIAPGRWTSRHPGGEEERWPRGWGGDGAAARCGS